jgi:hypothetical protein
MATRLVRVSVGRGKSKRRFTPRSKFLRNFETRSERSTAFGRLELQLARVARGAPYQRARRHVTQQCRHEVGLKRHGRELKCEGRVARSNVSNTWEYETEI